MAPTGYQLVETKATGTMGDINNAIINQLEVDLTIN